MNNIKISNPKKNNKIDVNNNIINSKSSEIQSPSQLKAFKQMIQEEIYKFITFKSVYDLILLVFINKNSSIVSYNLIDNKKIVEIKNSNSHINELKHYLDKNNKRDLVSYISMA